MTITSTPPLKSSVLFHNAIPPFQVIQHPSSCNQPVWRFVHTKDFSHYKYIAWSYIQNKDNLTLSRYVSALSGGFKDPLICDLYMSDMSCLSSLNLTSFLSEMRATFLPKDWDKKLQSKILSSFQSPRQPVTAWEMWLCWNNTLLRNMSYYHLRDDELLSCFKTHVNPALAHCSSGTCCIWSSLAGALAN